jgi:hypothetical protein
MSGADETTILAKMPYARALQYQNYWRMMQGVSTLKPKKSKGLKTVL